MNRNPSLPRIGWPVTPFEGNLYIRRQNLISNGFRVNYVPGLCIYKFLYVWLDFVTPEGKIVKNLGWKYWLPNPLFPFIWYRVAVPAFPSQNIDVIWVTEVWESKSSHEASLSLETVREAIALGKPLIAGFEERFETEPVGGHGLVGQAA